MSRGSSFLARRPAAAALVIFLLAAGCAGRSNDMRVNTAEAAGVGSDSQGLGDQLDNTAETAETTSPTEPAPAVAILTTSTTAVPSTKMTVQPTTTTSGQPTTTTIFEEAPNPAIAVAPNVGLPERAWVRVTGFGLPPSRRVFVSQCVLNPTGESLRGCDESVWVHQAEHDFYTNEKGDLNAAFRPVRRVAGGTDCAEASNRCVLAARLLDGSGRDPLATTPLSFSGPSGPERPMTVMAEPTTKLEDGQVISVSGEHLLASDENWGVTQCSNLPNNGGVVCGERTPASVDSSGRLQTTLRVHYVLTSSMGTVDCRLSSCYVNFGYGGLRQIPLSFAS
jgi:Neocarzinostatin family